ncbi:hypothetical protein CDL15_Pgr021204 [Punica granatum]|uniref:Uncharacterized protein n=1 Tax=Punica granatum TaxID=22663 RepID=A0A218WY01_PUNGR|nr:hypothetical protein CDL15_Pgr021204 [Punica granatum]PKI61400.1 hypothetical protein CRG98_018208 [Punica granatum]
MVVATKAPSIRDEVIRGVVTAGEVPTHVLNFKLRLSTTPSQGVVARGEDMVAAAKAPTSVIELVIEFQSLADKVYNHFEDDAVYAF